MPTYDFKNLETGEIVTHVMKMSELDAFKESNPQLERHISTTPGISDPVRLGLRRPSAGFRDLLGSIKKGNRGSNIKDY